MIGPLDEFPIHQTPLPIGLVDSSDRNFYDRSYFNAHDRTGDIFVITGVGYYPNLGTKDAFVLVRRGDVQTAVHLGDAIDSDRLNQRVNGYRIEVVEPLQTLRLILEETEGIAMDMTWQGSFDVLQEQPHIMRTGSKITLQAQRFAQVGTWSGVVSVDGSDIAVDPSTWVGTRDRSWGIRPVGEPEPAGRPADPPFEGMWWLYVPMRFEEFAIVLIMQEDPNGFRILNDCTRVWPGGRLEQLGWPKVTIRYASGTRVPTGATIECTTPDGSPLILEVESRLAVPIHLGGGYGGDPDWIHAPGRGRSSPNGSPMTSPTRRTRDGSCSASSTTWAGPSATGPAPTVSRGSGCSSTARWAGTTRRASLIGSRWRRDRSVRSRVPSGLPLRRRIPNPVDEEKRMRTLAITQNMTLDGSIEMLTDWFDPTVDDPGLREEMHLQDAAADALLVGRQTFVDFRGHWPAQENDTTGVTDYLNGVQKYVVSSTLTDPEWQNSTIVAGDPIAAVRELKQQPGEDIVLTGSIRLGHALLEAGLVDELRLFVYPVVQGRGRGLFPDGREATNVTLLQSRAFESGVVLLRYAVG